MKIRCLIIEDEIPAQRILINYISEIPLLELVKTYTNALEAMPIIAQKSIDLIFLDINLPKLSGVNFLKSLKHPPQVIFTTAYSEYAVEGFDLNVVDYLIKPFSFERFTQAINKVLPVIHRQNRLPTSSITLSTNSGFIFVRADKKISRVELDDILYIESLKDYLRINCKGNSLMILQSLKKYLALLPNENFIQSHKSFIVNIRAIDQIRGNVIQIGEKEIPIGRQYKKGLMAFVEDKMFGE